MTTVRKVTLSTMGALVLAAGRSVRRGHVNKLTELHGGKPLVCHAIDALLEARVTSVIVVTGYEANQIRVAVGDRAVEFRHNPFHASGMAVSIAAGVRALEKRVDGLLVCVGDLPELEGPHVEAIVAAALESDSTVILRPTHEGVPGHPVFFPACFFSELSQLAGAQGARGLIESNPNRVVDVPLPFQGIIQDFDSPGD